VRLSFVKPSIFGSSKIELRTVEYHSEESGERDRDVHDAMHEYCNQASQPTVQAAHSMELWQNMQDDNDIRRNLSSIPSHSSGRDKFSHNDQDHEKLYRFPLLFLIFQLKC
jgi:hypothetical protein